MFNINIRVQVGHKNGDMQELDHLNLRTPVHTQD